MSKLIGTEKEWANQELEEEWLLRGGVITGQNNRIAGDG